MGVRRRNYRGPRIVRAANDLCYGPPQWHPTAAQIVKTVERILYAVDDEEAKNIIADANRDAQAYRIGAATSEPIDAAAE